MATGQVTGRSYMVGFANMQEDIRDKAYITHDDLLQLNFIDKDVPYVFRRHYRQGLRSHVMEVLHPDDYRVELSGTLIDGTRWFPKAQPIKIFRLFRARLQQPQQALQEIEHVKIVEKYLAPEYLARSDEFIVDYKGPHGHQPMLCGLQEYVAGEIIDPWSILDGRNYLADLFSLFGGVSDDSPNSIRPWITQIRHKASKFISRIKQMIYETSHIPDLAGLGNMIMVPSGEIKLVDINNISHVIFDAKVRLDDRRYPVCDKSIEALANLERLFFGRPIDNSEAIYHTFLNPDRMQIVAAHEKEFYHARKDESIPQQV